MKKLVFIVGSGRSGSTVLCKSLGSHPQAFAISEVQYLKEMFQKNSHCSCGRFYQECVFWSEVLCDYLKTDEIPFLEINKGGLINRLLIIWNYYFNHGCNNSNKDNLYKTFDIYDKVFKLSDSDIIVDAGKEIYRAMMLSMIAREKGIECYFIYLTRNGRSVINSAMKKTSRIKWAGSILTDIPRGESFWGAIKTWTVVNLRTFLLCKYVLKDVFITIKLEEFVKYPERILNNIADFIGIEYSADMTKFDNKTHHMMGGNASRINAVNIKEIPANYDNLKKVNSATFTILAGWLNKLLGY